MERLNMPNLTPQDIVEIVKVVQQVKAQREKQAFGFYPEGMSLSDAIEYGVVKEPIEPTAQDIILSDGKSYTVKAESLKDNKTTITET
jgi:hypothetical protein